MRKVFAVDRIEEGITVAVSDDGDVRYLNTEENPELTEYAVFSADDDGVNLDNIEFMPDETERRLAEAREMLERLKRR